MSWQPNDLVTDADLRAYEQNILTQFGRTDWSDKREKMLSDWLWPILRGQAWPVERFRTRYEADAVYGYTGAAYVDYLSASRDTTSDDIALATVFTTVGTDALYVGSAQAFRGLSVRLLENVSAVSAIVTVSYWNDGWSPLAIEDGTSKTTGKAFSGGGAITWRLPSDWVVRTINSSEAMYFVKVTISATPTSAKAAQIGVIRRSSLSAAAALRTLTLIMWEAPTGGDGPWADKALRYETEANAALERALPLIAGEFDTDKSDLVDADEAAQTADTAGSTGFRRERH